jgi:hypothetical protein
VNLKKRDSEIKHSCGFEVVFLPTMGKQLPHHGEMTSPPWGINIPKNEEVCKNRGISNFTKNGVLQ